MSGKYRRPRTPDGLAVTPAFTEITQISVITRDTDAMVDALAAALHPGSFKVLSMTAPELFDRLYDGEPSDWSIRAGLTWIGDMQLEIIQPLTGRTVFGDFLEARGGRPGVEHIYLDRRTGSLTDAITLLAEAGFPWRQEAHMNAAGKLGWMPLPAMPGFMARKHGARFGYTSTQGTLKVDVELARFPPGVSQRLALRAAIPEKWVPAGDDRHFESMPADTILRDIDAPYVVGHSMDALLAHWGRLTDRAPEVVPYDDDALPGRGRVARVGFNTTSLFLVEPEAGMVADVLERNGEGVGLVRARPAGSLGDAVPALEARGWAVRVVGEGAGATHPDVPFALWLTESP
ncbi:MAG: hypothetical protein H6739_38520 [Alphaproteobacteria bacterium]|nr:hypothetical protein [Alphaproteobacteria bacterium]